MVTREIELTRRETRAVDVPPPNGAAMAAYLAAAIGAFAVGLFVILNELGIFAAPALYPPAGGVSGRTTLAVVVWIVAWVVLHARWKSRNVAVAPVALATAVLTALGILATYPPFWSVLG